MINKNLEVDFFYQHLPPGQKLSLDAFINSSDGKAVTYREASSSLGISVNTLKSYLRRIRRNDTDTYYFAMNYYITFDIGFGKMFNELLVG